MSFLGRILEPPTYGYAAPDGSLIVPTHRQLWREFFSRLNVFKNRKNWLTFFGWATSLSLALPLTIYFVYYCTWSLSFGMFLYSMVAMGTFGTFWHHRYTTHRAYQFKNNFFLQLCRNLVIKTVPEETYAISHHVHHQFPEEPGDPYNARAGWLYCFLADANHQPIAKDLSEKDYGQLAKLMSHTGVRVNSYAQYQKWGSLCHPLWATLHFALNWAAWYGIFFLLGGHALATAMFGAAGIWAIGVRTFNYEGHGRGRDRRRDGIDFHRRDWSINQTWPGYVAGEWHNNHHLFPNGARSGFLPYQLDLPWLMISGFHAVGMIESYKDYKDVFLKDYYDPYVAGLEAELQSSNISG